MSYNTYPQNPFPPNSENAGGGGSPYVLPIASAETLGGVKVGNNLTIGESGALNAPAPLVKGEYIEIVENVISVEREIPSETSLYEFKNDGSSEGTYYIRLNKYENGKVVDTVRYGTNELTQWHNFHDALSVRYFDWRFEIKLLKASLAHDVGYTYNYHYSSTYDISEEILEVDNREKTIMRKGDVVEITGDLSQLATTNKSSLVAAINEIIATMNT